MKSLPDIPAAASASAPPAAELSSTVDVTRAPQTGSNTWPVTGQPVAAAFPAIPGYKVWGEIARGGMGRVLAARDETLDREVAIKVLLPGAPASRFVSESRITARLPHPGIPPVHALGTLADGSPFLVMKLIRGRTLAAELSARPDVATDLPKFVRVFEQIAEAVGFAHAQGIVHRDLKPTNVMVGAFGEVQVMDWGLAKSLGEGTAETESGAAEPSTGQETAVGAIVGTPRYMAPEQARGEAVDTRTDVFALGAILAQVLTNRPVYEGDTAQEVVARAAAGDLTAALVRLDASGADGALVSLAKRCLRAEPENRPRDGVEVAALAAAYRAAVEERLRAAEIETAAAQVRNLEQRKRFRLRLWLAGLAVLLVALLGLGAWYAQRQETARKEREIEREQQTVARLAEQAADRARAEQTVATAQAQLVDLQRRALWNEAGRTLNQAAAAVGKEPDNADLQARIEAARRDLALVARLDEIVLLRTVSLPASTDAGSLFGLARGMSADGENANRAIAGALREHGLDVLNEPAEAVVAKIRVSSVREQLVAALDDWMFHERNPLVQLVLWKVTSELGGESWRAKLPTHSLSAELSRSLLQATPVEQRTPSLYLFLDGVMEYWNADGLNELREGCRRHPGHFFLNYTLAAAARRRYTASRETRYYDEATAACRAALAIRPESASVWMILAALYLHNNEVPPALDCTSRAVELNPRYAQAQYYHGAALTRAGKHEAAAACLREALRLDGTLAGAHALLGHSLARLRDQAGSVSALREAVRLEPQSPEYRFNLGYNLVEAGDQAAALPEFRTCAKLYSQDPLMLVRCALHLEELGDKAAMQAALDAAHKINSGQTTRILENQKRARRERAQSILSGQRNCTVPGELVVLGRLMATESKQFAAIARLCQKEFGLHTDWETWPADSPLYLAAGCAAMASTGQGDGSKLPLAARTELRDLSLQWLEKYLAQVRRELTDPARRAAVLASLRQARQDVWFFSVRDPTALRNLPSESRTRCEALWTEVDTLLREEP